MNRPLLALALLVPALAAAWPRGPPLLWESTERSPLVVVATVEAVHGGVLRPPTFLGAARQLASGGGWASGDAWARLRVDSVVVGAPVLALEVPIVQSFCPPPLDYTAGEQVLAFVVRDGQAWRVGELLHGPEAELALLAERVRAARSLQVRGRVTPEERMEWLVATAEAPATRWYGLVPLALVVDGRAAPRPSPGQLERLTRAFIAEPSTGEALWLMLVLLEPVKDPRLDLAVVRALDQALALPAPYGEYVNPHQAALAQGLRRFASEAQVKTLLAPVEERPSPDRAELEAAWKRAKAQLGLPAALPAP